ncbi:MAG: riboflavin kinase/FMN adenylyltransferase [Gammaproteobacteria bacterium]|jgi:riboflavin kinase/FMN adenylyltransferase
MELIRGLHNLRPRHRGCVLTIGVFDGVHIGHQAMLERLAALGHDCDLPSVLMVFEPQPQETMPYLITPARLTPFREKIRALSATAVDRVLCVRFNESFAQLSAMRFIEDILVAGLGAQHVVVGDDFRFGHQAVGDTELLRETGARLGFEVHRRDTYRIAGDRVSSTRIRNALAVGQLDSVKELLGRHYAISGRVRFGKQLGRTIGFPTANVALRHRVSPISGVFAVQAALKGDGRVLGGVANIGVRPTVDGETRLLEVNLFDFDEVIYGRHIRVELLSKLREEKRFESLDALKEQIRRDAQTARDYIDNAAGSL